MTLNYYCKYKLPVEVVRTVKGSKSKAVTATVCSLKDTEDVKKAAGYIKDSALYISHASPLDETYFVTFCLIKYHQGLKHETDRRPLVCFNCTKSLGI